jgi:hypothetical protein
MEDYVFRTKFESFMHDICLILHNHHSPSFFIFWTKTKNSNKYIIPKLNANIKFKVNLRWVKYVNIKNLDKNKNFLKSSFTILSLVHVVKKEKKRFS